VFVAFTAEEAGRLGSLYYIGHPRPTAREEIRAVINLDTVGRLGGGPVQVLGSGSAREWSMILDGVSGTTGIAARSVQGASQSSDQQSFIDAGIPGVQIFTGAHFDYHRPGDTADKVDADGLVRVATFVKETAAQLISRSEPLSFQGAPPAPSDPSAAQRRVSLGTVPEFGYDGPGIKVESVVPGSPAEQADIRPGDVITGIDDETVAGLAAYSEILKRYEPGQTVRVSGTRGGAPFEARIRLQAR
jgi:membrane-associated protease RseP (regulator of RpoE activity)